MPFPPMHYFLWKLGIKGYQDRTVGIVENGTLAPSAGKAMRFYLTDFHVKKWGNQIENNEPVVIGAL